MKLSSSVGSLPLIGPVYVKKLAQLNIFTVEDLLNHIPTRYIDFTLNSKISKIQPGETVTIKGSVNDFKNIYTKFRKKIQIADISDASGNIQVVWFNQPYLVRTIKKGVDISLSGKVDRFGNKKTLISPEYEIIQNGKVNIHTGRLVPIYHETRGISSKWLRGRIAYLLNQLDSIIEEYLPTSLIKIHNFLNISDAYQKVHFPLSLEEAENARGRLAFDELLILHLKNEYRKSDWRKNEVIYKLKVDENVTDEFIKTLPFTLTNSQKRTISEILADLESKKPMNRLLEGDVGSGKTVVAATAAFVAFANKYQSVFMAPTQILAQQHYNTLRSIFEPFRVRVSLITSEGIKEGPGKTDIYVGTHALIEKKVDFDNVAFVVIDEQHRFGVEQRAHLIKKTGTKTRAPHVLTMTATPIPRTVALTLYGDLDLSTLDELPHGRQKIITWIVPPAKREKAYLWIDEQIRNMCIQAFVICPLIEMSDKESMKDVKAVSSEYEKLKLFFPKYKLGLLHGRLPASEKVKVMQDYKEGKLDILVSTAVVEVGIDIENATIMVIEGSERFGLAQLHQLRGRVGRGEKKSYCLLFTESKSTNIFKRLTALQKTLSGFQLAELDLELRGPGEVFGKHQHGFFDLRVASWQDTNLIKETKKLALEVSNNPQKYSKLISKLNASSITPN